MRSIVVIMAFLILPSVCAEQPADRSGELLLTIEEGERPDRPIGGAEIRVVYSDGRTEPVSQADKIGIARINKDELIDGLFVIVCREGYICGAIDVKKEDLLSYDVFSIYLSRRRF